MDDGTRFPPGSLAVVAVPLGNPADISPRAQAVLRAADRVAAEDTRSAARLLARLGIGKPLVSYHDWNERERTPALLDRLARGERIALVSEAGTPGISDPGYDLVRGARERGIPVFPVPGPCALTAFLSASGLPTDAFSFFGFPPNRSGRRSAFFRGLSGRTETLVFYESPRRIVAALGDAVEAFGDRECALAREMTKRHEEFLFGPLSRVKAVLSDRPRVLGEVCWGVRGAARKPVAPGPGELERAVRDACDAGLPARETAREIGRRFGVPAKTVYRLVTAEKARREP